MESESTNLIDKKERIELHDRCGCEDKETFTEAEISNQVYSVRWWVLFVCSLTIAAQCLNFVVWMPLSDSLLIAYDWDVSYVGAAAAAAALTFVILALPVMYIIETRGLRVGMLIAGISAVLVCLFWNASLHTNAFWLFVIGSLLCGISPCATLVVPSLLSVTWFPVTQRTTATSIGVLSVGVGSGIGYIAGPQITGPYITAKSVLHRENLTAEYIADVTSGLQNVGYFLLAVDVIVLIMIVAYFPSAPPTPPSVAQTMGREDFWAGLQILKTNYQFWLLSLAFNLTNSPVYTWIPLLAVHFRNLGLDQDEALWIAIAAALAAGVGVFVIGLLADRPFFQRKTKRILQGFSVISIVLLLLLSLIQCEYIYISPEALIPLLCGILICVGITTQSIFPICTELACEYAYPVHEGLTCTVVFMLNWGISIIFLGLLLVPALSEDTAWMTWVCFVGCSISLPLNILLKDDFRRLDLDSKPKGFKESPADNNDGNSKK
ncbi:solute carrier family 49 member 4 homolog [Watersipora subatra]|uniref:solute carrier family 49 member 4 homolog n=1 Tax=Watersipora subatra TaxID=2589382 RepID=UPI00355BCB5F